MARGRKTSLVVELTEAEVQELKLWHRSTTMKSGLARRGRIILLVSEGLSLSEVARRVDVERRIVTKWVRRFLQDRIDGLADKAGRGRKAFFPAVCGGEFGENGLRASGRNGAFAEPMGLRGIGETVGRREDCRLYLDADGAPHSVAS